MKKIVLFLSIFVGVKIVIGQTVFSSCIAPDSIVALYKDDADRLAIKKVFRVGSIYTDSIKIPKLWSDTVMNALIAVYNATTLPARDTVISIYDIHTFPNPVLNNISVFADSNLTWMNQLQNNIIPTGNLSVDSLINDFGLNLSSYLDWWNSFPYHTAVFQSDSNYNIPAMVNRFLTIPGVFYAESSNYYGDGNDISDSIYSTFVELIYSYGWEDCPSGCINRRFWKFRVYYDCSVEYVGSYGTLLSNPATPLTINESHLNVSCFGLCDGIISLTPSGGTPPYITSGTFGSFLCSGTYPITVTDAVGASANISVTITEPPLLIMTATSTNVNCNGFCDGTANATSTGGISPYTYSWCFGATTSLVTGLCPGTCPVTVTDNNGCEAIDTVVITEPAPITYSLIATSVSCYGSNDGTICCSGLSGGSPPFSYMWMPMGGTAPCISFAIGGSYTFCVTDNNGCIVCAAVVVSEPPLIVVTENVIDASCFSCCDGSISLISSGGTYPHSFLWSTGDFNDSISSLCPGTYNYCVTDAQGCTSCDSITVSFPLSNYNFESDNAISIFPNPNNGNFEITNISSKATELEIRISDVNGKIILNEIKQPVNKKLAITSSVKNGIYFLYIRNRHSGQTVVKKLIIQN